MGESGFAVVAADGGEPIADDATDLLGAGAGVVDKFRWAASKTYGILAA